MISDRNFWRSNEKNVKDRRNHFSGHCAYRSNIIDLVFYKAGGIIVGKEETYTFIEKLLQSVKEAFSTRRVQNGIAPNYSKTFACTKAALQTCKKYLMKEVLCIAWMDNGAETPVDAVWPGVALFAHLGFHLDYNEKVLEEEFKECVGGNLPGEFPGICCSICLL